VGFQRKFNTPKTRNDMSELALRKIAEAKEKRLTRLDLGNCIISDENSEAVFEALAELEWLEWLNLHDWYWDFEKNESVKALTDTNFYIDIYTARNSITLIPNIFLKLKKLKYISLSLGEEAEIYHPFKREETEYDDVKIKNRNKSFELLCSIESIEDVVISSSHLNNISSINKLNNLYRFVLTNDNRTPNTAIYDINLHIQNLNYLYISTSNYTLNITGDMLNLKYFYLYTNLSLKNLDFLLKTPNLISLRLNSDMSSLGMIGNKINGYLKHLKELTINNLELLDIEFLLHSKDLKEREYFGSILEKYNFLEIAFIYKSNSRFFI
jgi:hypothetical protein